MDIKITGVTIPARRTTMGLRINPGDYIPQEGDTVVMKGQVAYYAVTVHRIKDTRQHPNEPDVTLLTVYCTKRVIANVSVEDDENEGDDNA